MQYNGVVMELNIDIPRGCLPAVPSNKKPEMASYSDMRVQGFDNVFHNTVDILGYNGSVPKSVSGRNSKKGPAKILTGPNKFVILGDKP